MIADVTRRGSARSSSVDARSSTGSTSVERSKLGEPSLVLVAGEAGVGKTRLVAEFLRGAEAAGGQTGVGGCLDLAAGGLPYSPFVEALRGLVHRMEGGGRDSAPGLSSGLPGLFPAEAAHAAALPATADVDPPTRLAALFDSVLDLLGRLSAQRPLVLVLEDLQWADGSTRDLIRFVVRNMRTERLLLVATVRADDLHRRHPLMPLLSELERADGVDRLDLPPFDRAELAEQLTGILGETPSAAVVDAMLVRSDGLPFYVEELVEARRMDDGLPATLHDILSRRLASLSSAGATVVRTAAVMGGRCSHALLLAASAMDESDMSAALREAIDAGILIASDVGQDPTYAFRHALMREAAYDELLPADRARLHARIADQLGASIGSDVAPDSAALADLATHAYRSHDQRRALEAAVNAIRGFVAAAAYRESLIHAERAVLLWPQIEGAAVLAGMSHPDLLELAGQIASAANRPELATAMTQDALAELEVSAGDDRRLTLLTALYMYAWEAQDFDAAASAIEQANGLVDTAKTSRTTALVLHWIGWHRSWQGRNAEALRLLEAAMAMEEALGDRAAWTDSAACAASVLAESGAVDRGAMLVDASVTRSPARMAALAACTRTSIEGSS